MDERLLNVNEHGVLAVDAGAVMLMLAAARHSILLLITLMTGLSAALLDVIAPDAFAASLVLLDSLALAVALAAARRTASAGIIVRRVWAHGRVLLLTGAIAHGALFLHVMFAYGLPEGRLGLIWCLLTVLDIACIASLRAPYFTQLFSEMPAPLTGSVASASAARHKGDD